jgi:threonine dehydrogenase-like Zn-dependent dehydrogenase
MCSNGPRFFIIACICATATFGPKTAAAQSTQGPCSLLTSAQVSAAVGVSVGAAQPIANTGCSWNAPHIIVTISLWDGNKWDQMKAPLPGATRSSVSGLGDDAFFSTLGSASAKQIATLSVKKGGTAYLIKVYGPDVTDQMSMEKTLAGDVLAKLSGA